MEPEWLRYAIPSKCLICGKVLKNNSAMKAHKKLAHYEHGSPLARLRSGDNSRKITTGMNGGGTGELELILAMDEYRRVNEVMHIPACELIEIFVYLGYRKTEQRAEKLADVGTERQ